MEEKFGKSARVLYIVSYSICIAVSLLLLVGLGAVLLVLGQLFGWFFIGLGIILLGASIFWLVYFIKMPPYTVIYKDGKLNFRNKVECTPDELDSYQMREFGVDGAMFGFGKLIVTINGKQYKFNYVYGGNAVVQRLYTIKVEYAVQQNIAKKNAEAAAEPLETEEKVAETEEKDG